MADSTTVCPHRRPAPRGSTAACSGEARGFTIVECLIAMSILGIVMAGLLPGFIDFMDANSISESRSDAVAAAQFTLESLRREDPSGWPTSGSSAPDVIAINNREFEVVRSFCRSNEYCGAASRHVVIEVSFGGEVLYSVETVYTRLQ